MTIRVDTSGELDVVKDALRVAIDQVRERRHGLRMELPFADRTKPVLEEMDACERAVEYMVRLSAEAKLANSGTKSPWSRI